MIIRPRGDWIVMEPVPAPTKIGSLHLAPEQIQAIMERPIGRVLAVGPDVPADKGPKVGQTVLYDENRWRVVTGLDTRNLRTAKWSDCIGIVEADPVATNEQIQSAEKSERDIREMEEAKLRKRSLVSAGSGVAGVLGPAGRVPG